MVCHTHQNILTQNFQCEFFTIIGASLSKPHDNGPRVRIYHLPHICRTLVPKIRVCPEILCIIISVY